MIGLFVILFLFITVTACNSKIPDLTITCPSAKVEVLKCPFSWNTLFNYWQKDYNVPPDLAKSISAATVKPQSPLNFHFSKKPERIEVTLWNEEASNYESSSKGLLAPKEKGTYVFAVIGYWNRGQVLYVFKLLVK